MRNENRDFDQTRLISVESGFANNASAVIFRMGKTVVNCSVSISKDVPSFVEDGHGWITAEYSMLPAATGYRNRRERGKVGGRTVEIQRLIGRSLRGAVNLEALGSHSIYLDCDVLYADGGTRCASISGSYIALMLALRKLEEKGELKVSEVIPQPVAAVSVGIVEGKLMLDLEYTEDSNADVDMNLIMTKDNNIIEIQGTAEGNPFSTDDLSKMIEFGKKGIADIIKVGETFLNSSSSK